MHAAWTAPVTTTRDALLVDAGKPAVPGYVRRENCRELPGLGHKCPSWASQTNTE
jgi:hypothetical protein